MGCSDSQQFTRALSRRRNRPHYKDNAQMTIYRALSVGLALMLCSGCTGATQELFAAKKQETQTSAEGVDAKDIRGQLQDHQIASLSGNKITGQLAGSLIDWRGVADKSIYGSSIRSIDGRKITGYIDSSVISWDKGKTQTLRLTAASIREGQLAIERLPTSIPFDYVTFNEGDKIPAEALPVLTAETLPPIPASSITGTLSATQVPPLDQLSGKATAAQLPDVSALNGEFPANRLVGTLDQKNFGRVPAAQITYHQYGEQKSMGKGSLTAGFKGSELEFDDSASGEYYWVQVGKKVTLQFVVDRQGGSDSDLRLTLPIPDIPVPTESMFSKCRIQKDRYFLDYAFGTSTIWPRDDIKAARTQPLAMTTTGSPSCPINDGKEGKTFQIYAPSFPANSRVTGTISYIANPASNGKTDAHSSSKVAP